MKNPFKQEHTCTRPPSQHRVSPTPSAFHDLTDTDLEKVQGGKDTSHVAEIVITKSTDRPTPKLFL